MVIAFCLECLHVLWPPVARSTRHGQGGVKKTFAALDRDGNGAIDAEVGRPIPPTCMPRFEIRCEFTGEIMFSQCGHLAEVSAACVWLVVAQEMRALMEELGHSECSDAMISALLARLDANEDGRVTFPEFQASPHRASADITESSHRRDA